MVLKNRAVQTKEHCRNSDRLNGVIVAVLYRNWIYFCRSKMGTVWFQEKEN